MKRWFFTLAAGAISATVLAGCAREVVVEHPGHCARAFWVEGHHDRYGRWRHGHWRCERHVVVGELE